MRHGTRSFDSLPLADVSSPAPMRDPQQPLIAARDRSAAGLVAPAVFPSIERSALGRGVTDPRGEAERLVAEARETARTMLAQAREVIAAEREQAVRQGYEEGFAKGMGDADSETAGLVRTCEQIGVHVMEERQRVLDENEDDVVELAIAIAQRIVGAAIHVDDTLVVDACRGAMRKAFQRGRMQVLAHPDDLAQLRAAGPELARELGGVDHLDFVEERRIDRGSVIVRTPAGEIDGTIRGKSDKIEQALREGIEARRAERRTLG